MSAAPNAARMTASSIARDRELLAREAADIAARAARFAEDPDRGINLGIAQEIADAARRLELRALKVQTAQETADLYNADLAQQENR